MRGLSGVTLRPATRHNDSIRVGWNIAAKDELRKCACPSVLAKVVGAITTAVKWWLLQAIGAGVGIVWVCMACAIGGIEALPNLIFAF